MPAKKATSKPSVAKKAAPKITLEAAPGVPMVEKRRIIKTEEGPVLPIEEEKPLTPTREHRIEPLTLQPPSAEVAEDAPAKAAKKQKIDKPDADTLAPVKLPIEEDVVDEDAPAEEKPEPAQGASEPAESIARVEATPTAKPELPKGAPAAEAPSEPADDQTESDASEDTETPSGESATVPEQEAATPDADPTTAAEPETDVLFGDEPAGDDLLAGDDGVHPMDAKKSKAAQEEAKRRQELEKHIENETYFLPINSVEKRRIHQAILAFTLLIVVLAVAAVAWAASTGLITVPGLS